MTSTKKIRTPPILLVANSYRNRALPRYKTDLRIRIAIADPLPRMLYARTSDLSTGGVSVILPNNFSNGLIIVGLKSPSDGKPVWLRALLRHRSGFRCGFQFVETTAQQRALIRLLCQTES